MKSCLIFDQEGFCMKRIIDHYLKQWMHNPYRKPLLLRGARQVGKTHAARELGKLYPDFVEINLEKIPNPHLIFEKDLEPERILLEISLVTGKKITPGTTLLFIDEIQIVPRAITALRYFYEEMPNLHVIAAGSLFDFAIEQVGIPVGRVESLYMYPMSFLEFLAASGAIVLVEEILSHTLEKEMSETIHKKLIALLGEYIAIGGMPQAIQVWRDTKDPRDCSKIHHTLLDTYRQDFGKYANKFQIKYVDLLFESVPLQLGGKFKYSLIEGEFRKRELAPALDLLVTAGIVNKNYYSSGQGIPIGAQMDPQDYKVIFLDIALSQAVLGLDLAGWFLNPLAEFVNKGSLVEALVGQELLAYGNPAKKQHLYYWHREERNSEAEVDYIVQESERIIPIEVKSGTVKMLKSIRMFLETHAKLPYGIRFSTQNYSRYENIHSYPLYAIAHAVMDSAIKEALDFE